MNGGSVSLRSIISGYARSACTTRCRLFCITGPECSRGARQRPCGNGYASFTFGVLLVGEYATLVVHADHGAWAAWPMRGEMKALGHAQVSKGIASSVGGAVMVGLISQVSRYPRVGSGSIQKSSILLVLSGRRNALAARSSSSFKISTFNVLQSSCITGSGTTMVVCRPALF